ncbi:uracil phosphoribosyltransferase [Sulfolobales archaeon HS-7]|nr:uracil phosphoribosyltransferase [Sulfolobales archaeon HS-7]
MSELGDLEKKIMDVVWQKNKVYVKDVYDELKKERDIAPTTVSTILDRLYHKGLVGRYLTKDGGLRYVYYPRISKEEFAKELLRKAVQGVIEKLEDPLIASILGSKDIEELRRRLEKIAP